MRSKLFSALLEYHGRSGGRDVSLCFHVPITFLIMTWRHMTHYERELMIISPCRLSFSPSLVLSVFLSILSTPNNLNAGRLWNPPDSYPCEILKGLLMGSEPLSSFSCSPAVRHLNRVAFNLSTHLFTSLSSNPMSPPPPLQSPYILSHNSRRRSFVQQSQYFR